MWKHTLETQLATPGSEPRLCRRQTAAAPLAPQVLTRTQPMEQNILLRHLPIETTHHHSKQRCPQLCVPDRERDLDIRAGMCAQAIIQSNGSLSMVLSAIAANGSDHGLHRTVGARGEGQDPHGLANGQHRKSIQGYIKSRGCSTS